MVPTSVAVVSCALSAGASDRKRTQRSTTARVVSFMGCLQKKDDPPWARRSAESTCFVGQNPKLLLQQMSMKNHIR